MHLLNMAALWNSNASVDNVNNLLDPWPIAA
jgi:hypothetical protein